MDTLGFNRMEYEVSHLGTGDRRHKTPAARRYVGSRHLQRYMLQPQQTLPNPPKDALHRNTLKLGKSLFIVGPSSVAAGGPSDRGCDALVMGGWWGCMDNEGTESSRDCAVLAVEVPLLRKICGREHLILAPPPLGATDGIVVLLARCRQAVMPWLLRGNSATWTCYTQPASSVKHNTDRTTNSEVSPKPLLSLPFSTRKHIAAPQPSHRSFSPRFTRPRPFSSLFVPLAQINNHVLARLASPSPFATNPTFNLLRVTVKANNVSLQQLTSTRGTASPLLPRTRTADGS